MNKPRKRPRDFLQAAKLVIDMASGQVEDREPTAAERGKDAAAAALGRKGETARARSLSPKKGKEIARRAAYPLSSHIITRFRCRVPNHNLLVERSGVS